MAYPVRSSSLQKELLPDEPRSPGLPNFGIPNLGAFDVERFLLEVDSRKVETQFCTCSCSCCCRAFLSLCILTGFIVGSSLLVLKRAHIFHKTTTESYYLDDEYSHYIDFLHWGNSGTGHIPSNFTKEAQEEAFQKDNRDPAGWENLCDFATMNKFIDGKTDKQHCSYSYGSVYLPACPAGFYQTFRAENSTPQACPSGFFCPENFVCTVPCVPGSQCYNSTYDLDSGKCSFPHTMESARKTSPLVVQDQTICPGASHMHLCTGGYYCPNAVTAVKCERGHFCSLGSTHMATCPIFATCPGNSEFPDYREEIYLLCIFIMLVIIVSLFIFRGIRAHLRSRAAAKHMHVKRSLSIDSNDSNGTRESLSSLQPGSLAAFSSKHDRTLDLSFVKLGLRLRSNNFKVLNGVTGRCRPGRVTAIQGPSGAGKTTLMNTLAGRASYGVQTGTLLINGNVDTIKGYSDLVGFVPQDDIMHSDLTVKENLAMCASLRLPRTMPQQDKQAIVEDAISVLELSRIRHSIIGDAENRGISGGQRKRVNIGMEMVADPSLLFLDEPTSGLDSTTSYAVVNALKLLAKKGANVIVVLHQPSYQIFEMFDDVIFLAKGGFSVYVGPANGAMQYFVELGFRIPELVNPADFFMDVIAGKYPRIGDPAFESDELISLWEESRLGRIDLTHDFKPLSRSTLIAVRPAGFWTSFVVFTHRSFTQVIRAWPQLLADVVLEAFAGILVGMLYVHIGFSELSQFIFVMVLALGLTISIASLRVFGKERVVYWREAAPGAGMNLNKLAYFMAKNVVEIPRLILLTFFFVMSFYPIVTPVLQWWQFAMYASAASFACSGFAYVASIGLDPLTAQLITVIWMLVSTLFSGLSTRLDVLTSSPFFATLSTISFARWFAELIFLQTVYFQTLAWRMPPEYYSSEAKFSALYGLLGYEYTPTTETLSLNVVLLIWLGVLSRIFAYVALSAFNRDKMGLSTLSQMSIYWIVNPIHDWLKARRARRELRRREQDSIDAAYAPVRGLSESANPFATLPAEEPEEQKFADSEAEASVESAEVTETV